MEIEIDLAACEGHGLCAQAADEVYEIDDDGYAHLRAARLGPELESGALAGAQVCPVAAIRVRA